MSADNTSVPVAELLHHSGWTRRLACSLAGSEAAADDVLQDTWIAALRRPPDARQPLRSWLGTVVRNHVFNRTRERVRREIREALVERHDQPASAEDRLERLQLHRILVELVEQLPPPYRRVVLLAYFEGLSSAAIASRENIAPSTVRGRLRTALGWLREALDDRLGGRQAWMLPVVEFTRRATQTAQRMSGHAASPAAVHQTAGATATTPGLGVYSFSGPLAWVSLAGAITTAALVWSATRGPTPPSMGDPTVASGPAQVAEATSGAASDDHSRADQPPIPAEPSGAATPVEPHQLVRTQRRAIAAHGALNLLALAATSPHPRPPLPWVAPPPSRAGACVIVTRTEGPIAKACAEGGRAAAKKEMKALVFQAKRAGRKYTCEQCHRDLDSYVLTDGAQSNFDELLTAAAQSPDPR
jgi:RNA polymerase sigma-70 factor (ECF subfamily)